jgi:hypothetical protein
MPRFAGFCIGVFSRARRKLLAGRALQNARLAKNAVRLAKLIILLAGGDVSCGERRDLRALGGAISDEFTSEKCGFAHISSPGMTRMGVTAEQDWSLPQMTRMGADGQRAAVCFSREVDWPY